MLSPYAGRSLTLGFGIGYYGPVAHFLGMLATTLDRFDRAEAHFEAAIRFNLAMGAAPCLNRTRVGYASMLLSRGLAGDSERADELLDSGITSADALGMKGVAEVARELRRGSAIVSAAKMPEADRVTNTTAAVIPSAIQGSLKREGDYWTISYNGTISHLRHAKGLSFIAHLLGQPRVEVHVIELSQIADSTSVSHHSQRRYSTDGLQNSADSDAGSILDTAAKEA